MFSVFACCAAPAKPEAEVVPVRRVGVFDEPAALRGPGMETFRLTEVEVPKQKGLSYDSRPEDDASVSTTASRFDGYERRLTAPAWERDERHRSWAPKISCGGQPALSPRETSRPQGDAQREKLLNQLVAESRKEERLKQLVEEIRPAMARGVRVKLIDSSTQLLCQCSLKLDMVEQTIKLATAFNDEQSIRIKDIAGVYKGSEFARKHPDLAHVSSGAIGIDVQRDDECEEPIFLLFGDAGARNDFYAFLKITRMAASNVEAVKASR